MVSIASLLTAATMAAAQVPPEAPPAAVTDFLAAVRSSDLPAARAIVAGDAPIMDNRDETPVESSLEGYAGYANDCERTAVNAQYDHDDQERAAVVVEWTCRSDGRRQDFIWTEGRRIVWIQFGLPANDWSVLGVEEPGGDSR
jgi:hypothetical protein